MSQVKYQYFLYKGVVSSPSELPEGVSVIYNYAHDLFDSETKERIYGYVEYFRKLSGKEMKDYGLLLAVVDDSYI